MNEFRDYVQISQQAHREQQAYVGTLVGELACTALRVLAARFKAAWIFAGSAEPPRAGRRRARA